MEGQRRVNQGAAGEGGGGAKSVSRHLGINTVGDKNIAKMNPILH